MATAPQRVTENWAGGVGCDGRAFHSSFRKGIQSIDGDSASQLSSKPADRASRAYASRDPASAVGNRGRDRIFRPESSSAALPAAEGDVAPAGALEGAP